MNLSRSTFLKTLAIITLLATTPTVLALVPEPGRVPFLLIGCGIGILVVSHKKRSTTQEVDHEG